MKRPNLPSEYDLDLWSEDQLTDFAESLPENEDNLKTLLSILQVYAEEGIGEVRWAPDYAEPGYSTDTTHGVFLANWNNETRYNPETKQREVTSRRMSRLERLVEAAYFSNEWCDEWSECSDCGKTVRTSPDDMSWEPSYVWAGELLCQECAGGDPQTIWQSEEGQHDLPSWFAEHSTTRVEIGCSWALKIDLQKPYAGTTDLSDPLLREHSAIINAVVTPTDLPGEVKIHGIPYEVRGQFWPGIGRKYAWILIPEDTLEEWEWMDRIEKNTPEREELLADITRCLQALVEDAALWAELAEYHEPDFEDDPPYLDVRLQLHEGQWDLKTGDPQFDRDGRGCWGVTALIETSVPREVAEDLLREALDQWELIPY